eukprot:1598727-Prymnesium_polylepis.1
MLSRAVRGMTQLRLRRRVNRLLPPCVVSTRGHVGTICLVCRRHDRRGCATPAVTASGADVVQP